MDTVFNNYDKQYKIQDAKYKIQDRKDKAQEHMNIRRLFRLTIYTQHPTHFKENLG